MHISLMYIHVHLKTRQRIYRHNEVDEIIINMNCKNINAENYELFNIKISNSNYIYA